MHKLTAIKLLGGTVASAAKSIGISYQAVDKWPEELPPRIADRVQAAIARSAAHFVIGKSLTGAVTRVWQKGDASDAAAPTTQPEAQEAKVA